MHVGFRKRNRKEGNHLEDLNIEVRIILNIISEKQMTGRVLDSSGRGSWIVLG